MIRMLDPAPRRKHDAYHRFLRAGAWSLPPLWRILAQMLVTGLFEPGAILFLDVDDTLFHKTGRKVEGAGSFRDAVRSTKKRVVYALGLNLIVLTLRIKAPWGGEPLGLPINVRLYKKGGPTHLDLTVEMLREARGWFPGRKLRLGGDGAYASLADRLPPQSSHGCAGMPRSMRCRPLAARRGRGDRAKKVSAFRRRRQSPAMSAAGNEFRSTVAAV